MHAIASTALGGLVLLLAVFLALVGLLLAQRRIPLELRKSHNAAIGIIYGTLHVTFGVIVGFSAFLVLSKYSASQNTEVTEAGDLVEIYRLAKGFPETQRNQIQELVESYTRTVVDEEWPLMRDGRTSPRARALLNELGESVQDFEPTTESEKQVYAQGLNRVHDLAQSRDTRLLYVYAGLPPILWVVLVVLATLIILYTYILGMENVQLHRVTVAALTAGITFVLLTIYVLDHPFGGGFRVGPEAFEQALNTIEAPSQQEN